MSSALLEILFETTLAGTVAIAWALLLRGRVRSRFGARIAYLLWAGVPIALLAVLLPARVVPIEAMPMRAQIGMAQVQATEAAARPGYASVLLLVWAVGGLVMLMFQVWRQHRFHRGLGRTYRRADGLVQAGVCEGLPAAVGLLRPRIVVPADFEQRYDEQERRLILEHERVHLRRGDLQANAFMALLRCLYWFNPLVHRMARCFRHDQELACDQAVISRFPRHRHRYGAAMLKTQLATEGVSLACHWNAHHPLKERIAMLKHPLPQGRRLLAGRSLILLLSAVVGVVAWAAQPPRVAQDTARASRAAVAPSQTRVAATNSDAMAASRLPPPRYPADAARHGISGRVLLKIRVGADGKVKDVQVEKSQPAGVFDAASMEAVRRWTFQPGRENGRPVESWVRVPIDFEAGREPADAAPSGTARHPQRGSAVGGAERSAYLRDADACGTDAATAKASLACAGHRLTETN